MTMKKGCQLKVLSGTTQLNANPHMSPKLRWCDAKKKRAGDFFIQWIKRIYRSVPVGKITDDQDGWDRWDEDCGKLEAEPSSRGQQPSSHYYFLLLLCWWGLGRVIYLSLFSFSRRLLIDRMSCWGALFQESSKNKRRSAKLSSTRNNFAPYSTFCHKMTRQWEKLHNRGFFCCNKHKYTT